MGQRLMTEELKCVDAKNMLKKVFDCKESRH